MFNIVYTSCNFQKILKRIKRQKFNLEHYNLSCMLLRSTWEFATSLCMNYKYAPWSKLRCCIFKDIQPIWKFPRLKYHNSLKKGEKQRKRRITTNHELLLIKIYIIKINFLISTLKVYKKKKKIPNKEIIFRFNFVEQRIFKLVGCHFSLISALLWLFLFKSMRLMLRNFNKTQEKSNHRRKLN